MLRCGCLKVRKDPLRFHPRSPNFQRFHFKASSETQGQIVGARESLNGPLLSAPGSPRMISKCFAKKIERPLPQGTCKLAKHLPRMGVEPCEQCSWGYGVVEELKCLEFFTGVQAQYMSTKHGPQSMDNPSGSSPGPLRGPSPWTNPVDPPIY